MSAREPQSMKALLPSLLRRVAQDTGAARALAPIWNAAAGPLIAKHAAPSRWEGHSLVLTVVHARWMRELIAKEPELRARMSEALGAAPLPPLIFRMT